MWTLTLPDQWVWMCIIYPTVRPNNTFQQACCWRAPPAMGLSKIHEHPNNAVSWFTTSVLKVRYISSLTHKNAHLNTLTLIDPNFTYFIPSPSCLNAWLYSRLVTKVALSRSKWLHYQGHLLESNLARLGPQTGPANLLNGHSFISRCLGAVACEVHSFGAKQDGCGI